MAINSITDQNTDIILIYNIIYYIIYNIIYNIYLNYELFFETFVNFDNFQTAKLLNRDCSGHRNK